MSSPTLLAIEIGGTKLQAALGTVDGRIHEKKTVQIDALAGADAVRLQLLATCRALLEFSRCTPHAVGVGFGGPIDWQRGTILHSHQVSGWGGFDLGRWLRQELDCTNVVVGNDSDTAALGEARFGAGIGVSPLLYVNSGSGVGGGLVVDERVYRGGPHGALEIGHLWLTARGTNHRRTLEQAASGWAIGESARRRIDSMPAGATGLLPELARERGRVDAELVATAARRGDFDALAILDEATDAMAEALAHAVALLGPRRVVLGGGVAEMGETLWIDPIRRKLAEQVYPLFRETYDVVASRHGQDVVIVGALALASEGLSEKRGS